MAVQISQKHTMEALQQDRLTIFTNKHKLFKRVKHFFNVKLNEYAPQLTNSRIKKSMIFLEGFELCLNYYLTDPLNKKEIEDLLFKELIKFIVRDIEQDDQI